MNRRLFFASTIGLTALASAKVPKPVPRFVWVDVTITVGGHTLDSNPLFAVNDGRYSTMVAENALRWSDMRVRVTIDVERTDG